MVAASMRHFGIFHRGRDGRSIRNRPALTPDRAAAIDALGGSNEASVTRRLAGTIFIIRVVSAALAYLSQILLARWMGGSDYGVYVYVWTWVLLLGSMMDFGISASAQKIIPEYRTGGEHALLRGFLSGSRWMTFVVSSRSRCGWPASSNCCRPGSRPTRSFRSISAASRCRPSSSPTPRTASRARTTGCGSA